MPVDGFQVCQHTNKKEKELILFFFAIYNGLLYFCIALEEAGPIAQLVRASDS